MSHGAMPSADPVVVVDYRAHLHDIQSNAPKLIKLHPLSYILAKLLLLGIPRLLPKLTRILLYYLLENDLTAGTVRPFSMKSVLK